MSERSSRPDIDRDSRTDVWSFVPNHEAVDSQGERESLPATYRVSDGRGGEILYPRTWRNLDGDAGVMPGLSRDGHAEPSSISPRDQAREAEACPEVHTEGREAEEQIGPAPVVIEITVTVITVLFMLLVCFAMFVLFK